jgi:hypothetical protein
MYFVGFVTLEGRYITEKEFSLPTDRFLLSILPNSGRNSVITQISALSAAFIQLQIKWAWPFGSKRIFGPFWRERRVQSSHRDHGPLKSPLMT